jgi:hypothetical protein
MTTARRAGTVSAAALSGLALTLGFAHAVAPAWVRRAGLDLWNLPSLRGDVGEYCHEASALEQKHDRLAREIETARHAAARLIDQRLTLAEAVDELAPVLGARPAFAHAARDRFGTETFRQTVAAYVIDKAEELLEGDPGRRVEVSARLRTEFAAIK